MDFSENGYYFAVAHDSTAVTFWDLRKQKALTTIKDELGSVAVVAFDKSGKYVAMGGKGGVKITTVKEWGITASLESQSPATGVVWNKSSLAVCSDKERAVHFYGVPP